MDEGYLYCISYLIKDIFIIDVDIKHPYWIVEDIITKYPYVRDFVKLLYIKKISDINETKTNIKKYISVKEIFPESCYYKVNIKDVDKIFKHIA